MQWTSLEHKGPSTVTLRTLPDDYCVLYRKKDNTRVLLDNTQRYLLYLYHKHHYLKVDNTFQKNFWTSLHLSDLQDDRVDIVCNRIPSSFMDTERTSARMVLKSGEVLNNESITPIESYPSIFVGRDPSHPKRGTCRRGVHPKEVTLNMSRNETLRMAAKQRGFVHFVENKNTRWIARWNDPVTQDTRYIMMKSNTPLEKFEQARLLKRRLRKLHQKQRHDIEHTNDMRRQLALAVFMLDHLCIRVGHEKNVLTEADTIGMCTLKSHTNIFIKNHPTKKVCLMFVGKDAVPFRKTFVIPEPYFTQCERMLRERKKDTMFFDISPSSVNRYISSVAPGCSAKTFRTLKASTTFQTCLDKTNDVRQANQKVARLLNHLKGPKKNTLNTETSRKSYIDPRVYIAHCKRNQVRPREGWMSSQDPLFLTTQPHFRF